MNRPPHRSPIETEVTKGLSRDKHRDQSQCFEPENSPSNRVELLRDGQHHYPKTAASGALTAESLPAPALTIGPTHTDPYSHFLTSFRRYRSRAQLAVGAWVIGHPNT